VFRHSHLTYTGCQSCKERPCVANHQKIFAFSYSAIIVLFICCGLALIFFAALELWHGLNPSEALPLRSRFNFILESIGLLTIAVVALELGQTILEEEVQRKVQVSAPTRVRRFLSRFMVSCRRGAFHRMFGDCLRASLMRIQPDCRRPLPSESRRACCWLPGAYSSN
jgi:hypothetical protein